MAKELAKKYKREILTIALILVAVLVYMGMARVWATNMTNEKDILSASAPETGANHDIYFQPGTAFSAGTTLVVTLDAGFTTTPTAPGDFDLSWDDGTSEVWLAAAASGTNTWGVSVSNTEITFISSSAALWQPGTSDIVVIEIGSDADAGEGSGSGQYTNPSKSGDPGEADTYNIDIQSDPDGDGTFEDTGRAMVAIIEGVTVSATVAETLTFQIANVTPGDCDTTFGDEGDASSVTNTSVDFGDIGTAFTHGCQDLAIGTNASNGYGVTSQENSWLWSAGNTIIDTGCDGGAEACTESAGGTWTVSTNEGFGHACDDITGAVCNTEYASLDHYRRFANISETETPEMLIGNIATPTTVTEKSRVEYKISIDTLQPAGTYTNIITYIATPNF